MRQTGLLIVALGLFPIGSAANVWTVSPDGTADFVRIQDAIDASSTGDEIWISAGTYTETLDTSGKVIDLIGLSGAAETIVDAEQSGSALTIPFTPGGPMLIRGLSFTNGIGTILRDKDREGRFGGGAWIEVAFPRFEACWFSNNTANSGGGIYLLSGAAEMIDCRIAGNSAGHGGGLLSEFDSGLSLQNCEIRGNQGVFGGGMELFHSRIEAVGCLMTENGAVEGGAVRVLEGGDELPAIRGSLLVGNSAEDGAALWVRDGRLIVEGTTIASNTSGPSGASVAILEGGELQLYRTILAWSVGGSLLECLGPPPVLDCIVAWAPTAGEEICLAGESVLFADPLFCDPEVGDFSLQPASPCLPGQGIPGCDTIGALGIGCDAPVGVVRLDWGTIKAGFR